MLAAASRPRLKRPDLRFVETTIAGVFEITIEWHRDERGAFGRFFCAEEFAVHGLPTHFPQCSISSSARRGTVRGFHFQAAPHQEAKLVQCVAGRALDVALDLRQGSPTYGRHHAIELSSASGRMLFIPEGCAHAFQTLEDATALAYAISAPYQADDTRGVAWDDPAIGVNWPITDGVILSDADRRWPRLTELR
jgi:dTDP-4-dehydrorhamnose 3,5-epimerase